MAHTSFQSRVGGSSKKIDSIWPIKRENVSGKQRKKKYLRPHLGLCSPGPKSYIVPPTPNHPTVSRPLHVHVSARYLAGLIPSHDVICITLAFQCRPGGGGCDATTQAGASRAVAGRSLTHRALQKRIATPLADRGGPLAGTSEWVSESSGLTQAQAPHPNAHHSTPHHTTARQAEIMPPSSSLNKSRSATVPAVTEQRADKCAVDTHHSSTPSFPPWRRRCGTARQDL